MFNNLAIHHILSLWEGFALSQKANLIWVRIRFFTSMNLEDVWSSIFHSRAMDINLLAVSAFFRHVNMEGW